MALNFTTTNIVLVPWISGC